MVTVDIDMPHTAQQRVIDEATRFNVLECGRRFGKTALGIDRLIDTALAKSQPAGWFAPTHKIMADAWRQVVAALQPVIEASNKSESRLELVGGGSMDFWSVDNPDSGRGRKYALVVIDEGGIIRDLDYVWQNTIRPTLTDYHGSAWILGTPKGRNAFHRMFLKGQQGDPDWKSWRLGSIENPLLDPEEIEAARRDMPDQVWRQEYMGEPADDGGNPFDIRAIRDCISLRPSRGEVAIYGVDLAKSQDWTWVVGLDAQGQQVVSERWQGQWSRTRSRLIQLLGSSPAIIDSTGVGDPIVEDLQRKLPNIEGFKFTAGSKQQIMEGLAAAIQQRRIGFCDENLISELETFEYEYTRTGVRYTAPQGLHDDGVCALALAVKGLAATATRQFLYSLPSGDDYDDNDDW